MGYTAGMIIKRHLAATVRRLAGSFPIVAILGPRQSGKTTLARALFAGKPYVSMEDLDQRDFARHDPRGFLHRYPHGAVIDEAQRVPPLFSYLQTVVDDRPGNGRFILTGSSNFLLMENMSQTLAGRVAITTLLPLAVAELPVSSRKTLGADQYLFRGGYPRVVAGGANPRDWYPNYIHTYLERDVRQLKNITDLDTFRLFVRLCAGRVGQPLNLNSLGSDCGITHNTARSWLSVLQASFLVYLLPPHYENFRKRLIRTPKLYFLDTGLLCSLLGIDTPAQLALHHLRGSIFESLVITELLKNRANCGREPHAYFWRDQHGHEIDFLFATGEQRLPVEIKAGTTVAQDYFAGIRYWRSLTGESAPAFVVYGGDKIQRRAEATVIGWRDLQLITRIFP